MCVVLCDFYGDSLYVLQPLTSFFLYVFGHLSVFHILSSIHRVSVFLSLSPLVCLPSFLLRCISLVSCFCQQMFWPEAPAVATAVKIQLFQPGGTADANVMLT